MEPVPRTALLEPWFRPERRDSRIRAFDDDTFGDLKHFQPQAIAASWERLQRLMMPARRRPALAPTHGVVVLLRPSSPRLTEAAREQLWAAFRVPVFEQVIGPRGELLATECGLHDGLHVESPQFRIEGEVDLSPCWCGKSSPRVRMNQTVEASVTALACAGTL